MKFIRLKSANWMVAMALLALPGALVTSCSKEANPTENVEPKGDKLVVSVLGIKNQSNLSLKGSTAGGNGVSAAVHEVHEFSDVDVAVSVGNNVPVKSVNLASKSGANGLKADLPAEAEAMEDNAKYVVYIYEADDTFVKAVELTAGTAGTVDGLDAQATYKWVALSYNSETDGPTDLTGGDVDLPEGGKTDVLRASGTIDLSQESTIDILFEHIFSRIGIELTTIGVFGDITGSPQVGVTGLELTSGSLNLLTNDLTPGDASPAVLTYADFERVDPAFGDQMIAYVYTAPTNAQSVQLTLQNLSISHKDGNVARTFFASGGSTQPVNVTPEAGKSHHLKFDIVESALTTNYDGHTVRWGRSNLYYTFGADAPRQYSFFAQNGLSNRANSYFAFGSGVPFRFPASTDDFVDPCALVYPAGLWRQPTNADFAGLVSGEIELNSLVNELGPLGDVVNASGIGGLVALITNLLSNTVVSLINVEAPNSQLGPNPYVYAQYNSSSTLPSTSTAFDENSNHLRFYYNGQVLDATVLQDLAEYQGLLGVELNTISVDLAGQQLLGTNVTLLDTYGSASALWTNEQGADILGLAGLGSWGYFGSTGREFGLIGEIIPVADLGDPFVMGQRTGEAINNVSVVGLSTSMKNVRCVRAN